ncbi:MAG: penicillin-binding protein, partial [Alphaproteobacteria bacterium]|nr:penicillin-binding protein [Alphaproteobacteria bacterium]
TLGRGETGSSVALPIWIEFMQGALAGKRATPFRVPEGIRMVLMNTDTGLPAKPGDEKIVQEAFRRGTEPGFNSEMVILDGSDNGSQAPTVQLDEEGNVIAPDRSRDPKGEPPQANKKGTDSGLY